ncbi:MAG TPA: NAD(+) synthetase [Bacteroidetes bacterium]|nr:NAD(+) synthetase [Bacteroidota bacterium]
METNDINISNPLALNMKTVRSMLVQFIKDELNNAGFTKAVIGLSGGIDSAVSMYLAVEALGAKNVLAVLMPYKTSNPESRADAEAIVKDLAIRSVVVDITSMVDPLFESQAIKDNLRKGNIMARQRMIVLYDFSQKERALVIGTSNKTESMLGYGTLFGDMACAINPLGDLYKTHVWDIAEELGISKKIIKKKPTADLWQGQTDEGELGFSYREADRLLYFMVDERRTNEELEDLGFAKSFISNVRRKIQINQFKRRPPVIAKISHRTVNIDFRYVRDWGI